MLKDEILELTILRAEGIDIDPSQLSCCIYLNNGFIEEIPSMNQSDKDMVVQLPTKGIVSIEIRPIDEPERVISGVQIPLEILQKEGFQWLPLTSNYQSVQTKRLPNSVPVPRLLVLMSVPQESSPELSPVVSASEDQEDENSNLSAITEEAEMMPEIKFMANTQNSAINTQNSAINTENQYIEDDESRYSIQKLKEVIQDEEDNEERGIVLEDQQEQIEILKQQLRLERAKNEEADDWQRKMQVLYDERKLEAERRENQLLQQLEEVNYEFKQCQDKLHEVKSENTYLLTENSKLKDRNKWYEAQDYERRIQNALEEVKQLQSLLQHSESSRESLHNQFKNIQNSSITSQQLQEQQKELQEAHQHLDYFRNAFEKLSTQVKEEEALIQVQMNNEIEELYQTVEQVQKSKQELEETLEERLLEIEKLQEQNEQLSQRMLSYKENQKELKNSHRDLLKINSRLQKELNSEALYRSDSLSNLEEFKHQIESLQFQILEMQAENENLRENLAQERSVNNTLELNYPNEVKNKPGIKRKVVKDIDQLLKDQLSSELYDSIVHKISNNIYLINKQRIKITQADGKLKCMKNGKTMTLDEFMSTLKLNDLKSSYKTHSIRSVSPINKKSTNVSYSDQFLYKTENPDIIESLSSIDTETENIVPSVKRNSHKRNLSNSSKPFGKRNMLRETIHAQREALVDKKR